MKEEKTEVVHLRMTAADIISITTVTTDVFAFNHHRSQSLPFLSHTTTANATSNDLSIFPPINHEGLPPAAPPSPPPPHDPLASISDDSDDNLTTALPPAPDPAPPPRTNYNISEETSQFKLLRFSLRFCNSNLVSFVSRLRTSSFFSCLWPVAATTSIFFVVLFWLRKRRRWQHNSLAGGGDNAPSVQHLKAVIKANDEKIIQLLEQISETNKLLLARHKDLLKRLTD